MKTINSSLKIVFVVGLLTFMFYLYNRQDKLEGKTRKNGVYCIAIIKKESATKGGRTFEYRYQIYSKSYIFEPYVNQEYFREHKIGDTIIIKVLKSKLPYSLVCEDIKYSPCFGVQPVNGWKELPKCR